ncbi:GGDEF domain-containing protein [Pseudoxanthomonas winnipegensis]|uniref:diguanylate cyclase n=2 Tax=Pseudoxanthomonas winnipegensis TaxID=2480810 RepID=A0A4Q8M064_9GAMM|nr:GGDEF domain-containing protein [Pseudoxanthomonas winnipegensis]
MNGSFRGGRPVRIATGPAASRRRQFEYRVTLESGGWSRMGWFNGRVDDLAPEQRSALIEQQQRESGRYVEVLFVATPLVFVISGMRDLLTGQPDAWRLMAVRGATAVAVLIIGWVVRMRGLRSDTAGSLAVLGVLIASGALAYSVTLDPHGLGLAHVVLLLMAMHALPLSLRLRDAIGMGAALLLPSLAMLVLVHASLASWLPDLALLVLGIGAGLMLRRRRLDIALELFELRSKLELRVDMDMLTGLLNREGWFRAARVVFTLTRDARRPMTLAYLDLDHFKRINDELGHDAGDRALALVADAMRRYARRQDIVGRLGGEEFVLLMPGLPEMQAVRQIQDLCEAVRRIEFGRSITFSAGLSQVRTTDRLEDTMRRADHALLQAKRDGRDRVLRAPAH